MTIHLGSITGYAVHLWTGGEDDYDPESPSLRFLCRDAGEPRPRGAWIATWTRSPEKVTCQSCIEWMHA